MIEWLTAPIDPIRAHAVDGLTSWHGRLMVVVWSVCIPIAVMIARFGKIWPGQKWPVELDNKLWWRTHLIAQNAAAVAVVIATVLILSADHSGDHPIHQVLGWATLALLALQIASGYLRGSKGGPTAPDPEGGLRGDHYDMSRRRILFEYWHKSAGYAALVLALAATGTGLWAANGPRWMWLGLVSLWCFYVVAFIVLQRRGRAIDTYQAIWGPSKRHPGNNRRPIGWGVVQIRDPEDRHTSKEGPK